MYTIKLTSHTGTDGTLKLDLPIGLADRDVEVVVVIQPRPTRPNAKSPEELGWPPGFFEKTYGSLKDDPIERSPQLDFEVREELE